jgi:hypothetical protein
MVKAGDLTPKRSTGITTSLLRSLGLHGTFASTISATRSVQRSLRANVSLTVIRDCMGHQSTKTAKRYARPSAAAIAAVTAALDRPLREGRKDDIDTGNDTRPRESGNEVDS